MRGMGSFTGPSPAQQAKLDQLAQKWATAADEMVAMRRAREIGYSVNNVDEPMRDLHFARELAGGDNFAGGFGVIAVLTGRIVRMEKGPDLFG